MTEDEAKTKWCFHFIASHTDPRQLQSDFGIEHGLPGPFIYHCIGSACMAWRWTGTHVNDPANPKGDLVWSNRSYGHCGLAGTPELERPTAIERRAEQGT